MNGPGAGDIAHVYLLDLGPDICHEEVQHLTYDDGTGHLLVVKGGHVFAYDVSKGPVDDSSLKWMYPLQEGPPVRALRTSLDNRMLAVQRSSAMLELVDLATGLCYVHSIHKGRGEIVCFFFTDAPETDVVIVTSRAVEINQFAARRQGLRCRERIRGLNSWAIYSHETRMVVVGSAAAPHTALSAWQFASHGIVHLPMFELQGPLPDSAAVRQFLPTTAQGLYSSNNTPLYQPSAAATAGLGTPAVAAPAISTAANLAAAVAAGAANAAGAHRQSITATAAAAAAAGSSGYGNSHRDLGPDRLWLLKMYGRVYLAHTDSANKRLELYRIYSDTIILQHVYELISAKIQLNVVDNTLLVHYPESSVVMLYDVALPHAAHLVNPLPLRRLRLLPPNLAAASSSGALDQQQQQPASSSSSSAPVAEPAAPGLGQQQQHQGVPGAVGSGLSRSSSRLMVTAAAAAASASTAAGVAAAAATTDGDVYEDSETQHAACWEYCMPGLILDKANKTIGRLQLDLQAICDSAEDWPTLVSFLLRRHALPASAPYAVQPRSLIMQVVRGAVQEKVSLSIVRQIFSVLLQAYADAVARTAAQAPGLSAGSRTAAAVLEVAAVTVITPNELARDLFQWVHKEEVVDALYLQAAVSEYCAASDAVGVAPPAYLQLLSVDLLLQQEQHYQAVQMLYSQPHNGSHIVAQHLLEVAGKDPAAVAAAGGAQGAQGGGGGSMLAGFSGAVGRPGGLETLHPSSAMALELALDLMSRQCVTEMRVLDANGSSRSHSVAAAAAGGVAATAAAGGNAAAVRSASRASSAALVRQLLSLGQVLQAVRVAQAAGGAAVVQIPAVEFLSAAAALGDAGTFAAVYRVMRPQLVESWPDFAAAKAHFWGLEVSG